MTISLRHTAAAIAAILALAAASCRTSEANYRAAYEKAVAVRDDATPLDSTVYGKMRREMQRSVLVAGTDTVPVRVLHVSPTPAADGTPGTIRAPYGIVAGQFKQLFNARSLCARLHETGYTEASVVNTAEPYYYVVASWQPDAASAAAALRELERAAPVALREPLPFVLQPARR
ncbi:MAG: hypothetical protein K2L27_07600 [Muribaculaceae bacterium]|nr:hypothetical protein [Muribaculaceae bacterium]